MKKRVFGKKLSRSLTARKALVRSLVRALVVSGKVTTTLAKGKLLQRSVEKLITTARKGSLSARRKILAHLANDRETVGNIVKHAQSSARSSGFTRLIKLPARKGDACPMARVEFVDPFQRLEMVKSLKKAEKEKEKTGKVKEAKKEKKTE